MPFTTKAAVPLPVLAGRFPFGPLIRIYDFEDINQAVADSLNGTTIKPAIRMPS